MPCFDDAAVLDDEDDVGVEDRREPVRDHEARAAFHQRHERGLDRRFVGRVERAGRFVEDEDARVLEQHARDREPLALAAGELVAALADDRVVAVGQRRDEVVDVRGARGGDHFGFASRPGARRADSP